MSNPNWKVKKGSAGVSHELQALEAADECITLEQYLAREDAPAPIAPVMRSER